MINRWNGMAGFFPCRYEEVRARSEALQAENTQLRNTLATLRSIAPDLVQAIDQPGSLLDPSPSQGTNGAPLYPPQMSQVNGTRAPQGPPHSPLRQSASSPLNSGRPPSTHAHKPGQVLGRLYSGGMGSSLGSPGQAETALGIGKPLPTGGVASGGVYAVRGQSPGPIPGSMLAGASPSSPALGGGYQPSTAAGFRPTSASPSGSGSATRPGSAVGAGGVGHSAGRLSPGHITAAGGGAAAARLHAYSSTGTPGASAAEASVAVPVALRAPNSARGIQLGVEGRSATSPRGNNSSIGASVVGAAGSGVGRVEALGPAARRG